MSQTEGPTQTEIMSQPGSVQQPESRTKQSTDTPQLDVTSSSGVSLQEVTPQPVNEPQSTGVMRSENTTQTQGKPQMGDTTEIENASKPGDKHPEIASTQKTGRTREEHFHTLRLIIEDDGVRKIQVLKGDESVLLTGLLGTKDLPSHKISVFEKADGDTFHIEWTDLAELTIGHTHDQESATHCYAFYWRATGKTVRNFTDAYDCTNAHWYGATAVQSQLWPLEKWRRDLEPYVTGDSFADKYGGVQERYWLSSNGVAIFIDKDVPLFVAMNSKGNNQFQFVSKYERPFWKPSGASVVLKYQLVHSANVRTAHEYVVGRFFPKPENIPDERMFTHPIWSTWAMYKKNINEQVVLEFADKIREHGFKDAQLEIDDKWTPGYGDWDFDRKKFPDPKRLVDELGKKGFRTTVWVHPFSTPFARSYWKGITRRLWSTVSYLGLPSLGIWWNGIGTSLDLTNPQAVDWFREQLKNLKTKYGISSFKFDAGETNWLPPFYSLQKSLPNPNEYTKLYAELAYSCDQDIRHQEIRAAVECQHLPVFVRMMDKDSNWGYKNGLKTLIPHVLTFGVIGYPFVLPDMIGGNAYSGYITGTVYPERELFIRWLQATVFMPSMQFSVTPWLYDDEVVSITRFMVELHETYAPFIIELAKECVQTGAPINRPLWWLDPEDETCQVIDSEFLLGDTILSAPILDQGALKRDVYLPKGMWRDGLRGGEMLEGGRWITDYRVELHELAYFTRVENK